jgi:hypothetical protein
MSLPDDIPGLGRKRDRPQPNRGVHSAGVSLTPLEGFVLSRVDGQTSYEDLCQLTGLGAEPTLEILRKLKRERLIVEPGGDPPPRPSGPRAVAEPSAPAGQKPPPAATPVSLLEALDDLSPVDPAELAGGPDLDAATKARVVRLHRRLATIKPHELLGVAPGADPAAVKKAYFAASKELHPDRFYGREIGPFRGKLSDIFTQLTRAFSSLQKR